MNTNDIVPKKQKMDRWGDFLPQDDWIWNKLSKRGWLDMPAYKIGATIPAANIEDKPHEYELSLAVPGMQKEDFSIKLKNGTLAVSCNKECEHEEKRRDYTRKEFCYTSFERSFCLPENVDTTQVKADYQDGVLTIHLTKKESDNVAEIKIQ